MQEVLAVAVVAAEPEARRVRTEARLPHRPAAPPRAGEQLARHVAQRLERAARKELGKRRAGAQRGGGRRRKPRRRRRDGPLQRPERRLAARRAPDDGLRRHRRRQHRDELRVLALLQGRAFLPSVGPASCGAMSMCSPGRAAAAGGPTPPLSARAASAARPPRDATRGAGRAPPWNSAARTRPARYSSAHGAPRAARPKSGRGRMASPQSRRSTLAPLPARQVRPCACAPTRRRSRRDSGQEARRRSGRRRNRQASQAVGVRDGAQARGGADERERNLRAGRRTLVRVTTSRCEEYTRHA